MDRFWWPLVIVCVLAIISCVILDNMIYNVGGGVFECVIMDCFVLAGWCNVGLVFYKN